MPSPVTIEYAGKNKNQNSIYNEKIENFERSKRDIIQMFDEILPEKSSFERPAMKSQ